MNESPHSSWRMARKLIYFYTTYTTVQEHSMEQYCHLLAQNIKLTYTYSYGRKGSLGITPCSYRKNHSIDEEN